MCNHPDNWKIREGEEVIIYKCKECEEYWFEYLKKEVIK